MVPNPTNAPSSVGGWHAVEVNYYQENYYLKVYVFESQKEYSCVRLYSEDWTEWVQTPTCTPPQEFDLPLAEGVSGLAKYSKDQFGRVQLRGWVTGATANSVVATLPSGFRPASGAHFIQAISSSTQNGIARVVVRTDGTVYIEFPQNGALASGLSLQLSFAAAS